MQQVWNQWEEEHAVLTEEEYYFAGIMHYCIQDIPKALQYFKKLGNDEKSEFQKIAYLWQEYLQNGSVVLETQSDMSARMASEIALLSYFTGNPTAWQQSYNALKKAQDSQSDIYWQNLAMTCPEDTDLWKEALAKSFLHQDKPFFHSYVFYSLYKYVCQNGSPFSPEKNEEENRTEEKNSLWNLAYHYGNLGYYYHIQGDTDQASFFWQSSLELYNRLFLPMYRGNLKYFSPVHITQMSQVWFICGHYEDMLFYLYRPDSKEESGMAGKAFRPALQFLSAAKLKKLPLPCLENLSGGEPLVPLK